MRPHKLTLEGFTSFRDKVELDFSGLDLFAITGPTGAGKSSLIDAICFALYGQVPRVGDDYKQLISHGAERLSVMLEFGVGKERYRIARTARPDKPSQQRLERITGDAAEPIADRVKEIRTEVDRILGLDYDGFTRSVVLPQGQFDAFLKGEPKERRKILVALLNLTVYERMQQLANQRSSAAKTEADFIKRQLETDFADATQEALEQKKAELKTAEACARQAEAALAALAEASRIAQQVRSHRKDQASLAKDHADETSPPRESPGHPRRSRPGEEDARPGAREAPGAEGRARLRRSPPHDPRRREAPRRPARQPPTGPREGHEGRRRQAKRPRRSQEGRRCRRRRRSRTSRRPKRTPEPRRPPREPRRRRRTASTPPSPSARASSPATPAPSARSR